MDTAVGTERIVRGDQLYLWVWGALLVFLGLLSLAVNPNFGYGETVTHEHIFWVVETNGWHGLAGFTFGLLSLAFARSDRWAPLVAAVVGGVGGVVPALIMFAVGPDSNALGLIPVDYYDAVIFHLLPGVVGLATARAATASGGRMVRSPDNRASR